MKMLILDRMILSLPTLSQIAEGPRTWQVGNLLRVGILYSSPLHDVKCHAAADEAISARQWSPAATAGTPAAIQPKRLPTAATAVTFDR
jgi:hypothetical protein